MKTIAVWMAALVVAFVGCSDVGLEPVAEQSQSASFFHGAHNGGLNISVPATRYCHTTRMSASNGHAGSANWPNGQPKFGAIFDGLPAWIQASPVSTASGGDAVLSTTCEDFSNFFGAGATQTSNDSPPYLLWGTASGQNNIGGTLPLWNFPASFCFIVGTTGVSAAHEFAAALPPDNWSGDWRLDVFGTPTIGASAKCVYPDRAWTYYGPTYASPGSPAAGPATASSVCALRRVQGNLDGGSWQIAASGGNWSLSVTGSVTAELSCMMF